jgi:hypothetical protein
MVRPPQTGKIREGRSFVVETDSVVVATELGLPEYDDVSTAPQTQNRLVYATGDGPSAEGIYKHDGSTYAQVGGGGTGQWEEDGSGAIVPIDGETVGDGTTEADHRPGNDRWTPCVYPVDRAIVAIEQRHLVRPPMINDQ